jgi:hypothetical protein
MSHYYEGQVQITRVNGVVKQIGVQTSPATIEFRFFRTESKTM